MPNLPLGPFRGIDARPGAADQPGGLSDGLNVVLSDEGTLVRRPVLVWRAALPSDSKGLHANGDELRTLAVYNAGDLTADDPLAPTIYVDYITDPAPLAIAEVLGEMQGSDNRTVALVRYTDNSTGVHRCNAATLAPPAGGTLANVGFTPDFSLISAAGRAFILSGDLRFLNYSALESDSSEALINFTPSSDAGGGGFLAVGQYANGVGAPQALGKFGDRVVVFYRNALLIYRVDADQGRFLLEQQITGPGTTAPRSVAAIGPDTMFLSDDGVSVMSTVLRTLDAPDDGISGRINHLARRYAANQTITPVGFYARNRGMYLLAFGQDVLCLTMQPGSRVYGWSRWRLPVTVDDWEETAGTLWMRSGNNLYSFSDDEDDDEVSNGSYVPVPVLAETLPLRGTRLSLAQYVAAASTEPVQVQVVADGRPGVDTNGIPLGLPIVLPPRAPEPVRALVGKQGRTFAVRIYDAAAKAGWRLDGLWLDVDGGRG